MIKFSVIIPVYNAEKYLKKCVESILNQSYEHLEVILVNDGSTDSTQSICHDLAEHDARVLYFEQQNSGPSVARQNGLKQASGDYVSFVDSDDYLEEGLYETILPFCKEGVDIIEFGYFLDDGMCKHCHEMIPMKKKGEECLAHYIYQENTTNYLWNKVFKKTLFLKIEFPKLYMSEDQCILAQLYSEAKQIVTLKESFYNYCANPESLCRSPFSMKTMDVLEANDFIYRFLLAHNTALAPVQSIMGMNSAILVYNKFDLGYFGEDRKQLKQQILENFRKWRAIFKEQPIPKAVSIKQKGKWLLFQVWPGITTKLRNMKKGVFK